MYFSRRFLRFNWITLVLIYLVVLAGSFVRITGSGMGCPDWPKCFGKWVPPTNEKVLPNDYKAIYSSKRAKKINKFSHFLSAIGMKKTASMILEDPTLLKEEDFNARKTWTEYINRLLGFLAGNAMLISFFWLFIFYRKSGLLPIALFNLILMAFQAWFGSIVVASNLVPWTITVHLLLALIIIGQQLFLIHKMSAAESSHKRIQLPNKLKIIIQVIFIITFFQMFLGTQVREYIDELTKQGFGRETWTDKLGWGFYIHRSFSWLVLILLGLVAYQNEKVHHVKQIRWSFAILVLGLISGVLLAYADMPGLVQTSHLLFASILFGILSMLIFGLNKSTIKGQSTR